MQQPPEQQAEQQAAEPPDQKPDQQQVRSPRNVLPELIIPALALLFAIYYLTTIIEVPWIAQASAMLVSVLLLLSIIAFAIRTVYRIRAGTEYIGFSDSVGEIRAHGVLNLKRGVLFLLTVLYVVLLPWLGFSIATFLLIFLGILVLSHGQTLFSVSVAATLRAFLISLVCTSVGYLAFIHLFKTRFPFGPVEKLIKGWLQ